MRVSLFALALACLAVPARADYVGVAGDYGDSLAPLPAGTQNLAAAAPAGDAQPQPTDYVGVADGFSNAPAPSAPTQMYDSGAPIPLTGNVPSVTITPRAGDTATQGNFTFVPQGAVAPPPPLPAAMTRERSAIANNYPTNTYDGAITAKDPIVKQYKQIAEARDLPDLVDGAKFSGPYAVNGSGPRTVTVNNNADWVDIWQNQIGTTPPGKLSRNQKGVVIFDAPHGYSGYTATLTIANEDSNRVVVNARHETPSQRQAIMPENSSPYAAIVLDAEGKTIDVREAGAPSTM